MGFYHLHLGHTREGAKISGRTDEVIFAKVDREHFTVVGIFDHTVFDETNHITQAMSSERQRLWEIFEKFSMQGAPANSIIVPSSIMLSGHSLRIVQLAQKYTAIIRDRDPMLDDRSYLNSLYGETGILAPKNPKPEWYLRGTDIGVFDRATNLYVVYGNGFN